MDNELNNALQQLIDSAIQAKEFILSQLPDVIQQLLLYTMIWDIAVIIGYFVYMALCFACFRYFHKRSDFGFTEGEALLSVVLSVFGTIVTVCYTVAVLQTIRELFLVWLAPKIFLIEYASHLVK
jgi:heme/copper-type cytochrome/quinol oxidase subunit 2